MQKAPLEMQTIEKEIQMEEVLINGEFFYKITHVNGMRPFFMTIVSDSNHWMFVASNGGISAGKKNAEYALFPYYTDDKITESVEHTGCKTIIRVTVGGEDLVWEPFSIRSEARFDCQRNLYKNRYGNKIIFEEINDFMGLTFYYEWNSSTEFGFVRKATLVNHGSATVQIDMLDGFQNLLPYGVGADLQNAASNLADAYKRSELLPDVGIGIFALSAIIVDKAEPSEALKANTVWQSGMENPRFLLSTNQLPAFRKGESICQEEDVKGEKGAYLVNSQFSIDPGKSKIWYLVANVNQTQSSVVALAHRLKNQSAPMAAVLADVEAGSRNLVSLVAAADGLQFSADDRLSTRHFSNVLFNIMRGGIFDNNYQVEKWDLLTYIQKANRAVFSRNVTLLQSLPDTCTVFDWKEMARQSGDIDLQRLAIEYLPLKFSRRHGDPSRPWNKFTINTRSELDGSKILDYEGNWRDIFQNWEALAHAYPEFIEGMIVKFLNASTFDGYNPYRVTKGGFDWETIEPENPWSYIGYWGDHQIIYLLKLLEFAQNHNPDQFSGWLSQPGFVYAHVPYRIKSYSEILKNPKDTIEFDHKADLTIRKQMEQEGADGALLKLKNGNICQVGFSEKILATVLAKLSNLVPEGGIWMNTQRPEWNDANNALVGNGLSMVTVCYLRRFLAFFLPIFDAKTGLNLEVSEEMAAFFVQIKNTFDQHTGLLSGTISDVARKQITDALGEAGSAYRTRIYAEGFSGKKENIQAQSLADLLKVANAYLEHTIAANRRKDGLYHTYNLISLENEAFRVSHLSEMLEGQVAVLSSGLLSASESLQVLDALRASALYRQDQNSFILYPNKNLPRFLAKNNLTKEAAFRSLLLKKLLEIGNRQIVEQDINGNLHFNGNFRNAMDLASGLENLDAEFQPLVESDKALILSLFESVFNHKEFTGRSGTFYGYEGLGSIYWHMVSKLGLAAMESTVAAIKNQESKSVVQGLVHQYYAIQDGIGVHKTPQVYGAFPTDPYSHTPLGKGAQQPGMTGQVKEDILCRIGELGVEMENGALVFNPVILKREQFLSSEKHIEYVNVKGDPKRIMVSENALFFTWCQVPVIYQLHPSEGIEISFSNGRKRIGDTPGLTAEESNEIFCRSGTIEGITVNFQASRFW